MNYQSASIGPLGAGMDQLSPENKLPEGFSEYLRNIEPTPEDSLKKRRGYAMYSGAVPLRVEKIDYTGDDICLYFDDSVDVSSIDLTASRGSPILVYGRTANSHADGDFTNTDSLHWYDTFTSDPKQTLAVGTNTLTLSGGTHGQGPLVSVGISLSTSTTSNDNSLTLVDGVTIDQTTDDVELSYTNGSGQAQKAFVYVKSRAAVAGLSYVSSPISFAAGTSTATVTAGTHGLNNFNILTEVYQDTGSDFIRIIPDEITINSSGTVSVTLTNGTGSSFNILLLLYISDASRSAVGAASPNSTITVTLPSLTSNFIYPACYLEDTITGTLTAVIPESVTVDESSMSATVTFINSGPSANFAIFWDEGFVTSNKLCVVGSTVTTPYSDENVQMTVWGLSHRTIYASYLSLPRAGWVNHLDNYRSEGEERLIAGLGGNLYGSYTRGEAGDVYGLPLYYPALSNRIATETVIGPAFVELGSGSLRSRGYIEFLGGGGGWARVISVAYVSGNTVKYTLNCPSLNVSGSLSSIVSTDDRVTFTGCGWSRHNGNFPLLSIALGVAPDTLEITIENSEVDASDWDLTGLEGKAGFFTDKVPLSNIGATESNVFLPNDILSSSLWGDEVLYVVVPNTEVSATFISGIYSPATLPTGLRVTASRAGALIPLRTLAGSKTVTNLVKGDTVFYSAYARPLRVKYVRAESNTAVTVIGDGEVATVTLGSGTTTSLSPGQTVGLLKAGAYSGEQVVSEILSDSEFTFAHTADDTLSAVLLGKCIELDETLTWEDTDGSTTTVDVQRRWLPIEAPNDLSSSVIPSYHYRYFTSNEFSNQPFLRSVISKDSLFLTNGDDAIQKFDGENLYRAGLPRFQLLSYISYDTGASAKVEVIVPTVVSGDIVSVSGNVFKVAIGEEQKFVPGVTLRHSFTGGSNDYTVTRIYTSDTNGFIEVLAFGTITLGTSPSLSRTATYKHYARLNAIDTNGNVVASAVCGSEDYRIILSESAAIYHKLVVPSAWDTYHFARIEAQIYRTKQNEAAPFYRRTSLSIPFGSRFLEYVDTGSDDTLTDLDPVNSSLLGTEIGTGFSHPLKAKWCTSLGNRLVLGNLESWPYINLDIVDSGTYISPSTLSGLRFLLRKDSNDNLTTSNVTDRLGFEFKTSGANTITPGTDIAIEVNGEITITDTNSLSVGDWVYFFHSAGADGNLLSLVGHYRVTAASPTEFTVDGEIDPAYIPSANDFNRWVTATATTDVPVWIEVDGNYANLNGNLTAGLSAQNLAVRRTAVAVNSAMARISNPWVIANAGGEYRYGELSFDFAKVLPTTPEIVLPTFSAFNLFANDILRSSSSTVQAVTSLFPSRILISLPSHPEMFDTPMATLDTQSLSAIDVDRDNGQEAEMGVPFFGDSAFGAAQKDGILLVFKTNSIYLVNVNAKAQGLPCVQKLDSQGKGCQFPFSVSSCRNSVMFGDGSGIYRVGQDLKVDYIGRRMQRVWRKSVGKTDLEQFFGHYSTEENKYKLTLPYTEDALRYPLRAFVYDTTREYTPDGYRDGSWTTYSNVASLGWCNTSTDEFFASPYGEVFLIRKEGAETDYRDDGEGIDAEAILRAVDFGDSAIRKTVPYAIAQFRTEMKSEGTTVEIATDLKDQFLPCDELTLKRDLTVQDALGDEGTRKVETLRFSLPTRKAIYYQVKLLNSTKDEDVELTSLGFRVAGLNERGTREAKDTEST